MEGVALSVAAPHHATVREMWPERGKSYMIPLTPAEIACAFGPRRA